jgi:hypothetical protein
VQASIHRHIFRFRRCGRRKAGPSELLRVSFRVAVFAIA